jgi:nitrite reductase/ring-hydroxylating ferredoxin subunit
MPHVELLLSSLEPDKPLRIESEGMAVVVIQSAGNVFAYEDSCPHAFWPLSDGLLRDGVLECPGHAWEFRVDSGQCTNAPAYCLNRVSVSVEGEVVRLHWEVKTKPSELCRP